MTTISVLDREMFSEAEAARLLRVSQSTLNYWLEGGERRGKIYRPVIRVEPRGGRVPVTWAEFVEAGLLRAYRRHVPMAELRAFIDRLRSEYGIPYPLADRRPFVADKQLVHEAQEAANLDAEFCLVAEVHLDGGESETEIAETFGLSLADVGWALAYELPLRSA